MRTIRHTFSISSIKPLRQTNTRVFEGESELSRAGGTKIIWESEAEIEEEGEKYRHVKCWE
jgi:hypothetical protein